MNVAKWCDDLQKGARFSRFCAAPSSRIEAAERVAIVGSSGSGKTTLLQIMGGLDDPDEGSVLINGETMNGGNEAAKGKLRNRYIGFIYQFHHLLPEFSAEENVAMPLLIRRETKAARSSRRANCWRELAWVSASRTNPANCRVASASVQRLLAR